MKYIFLKDIKKTHVEKGYLSIDKLIDGYSSKHIKLYLNHSGVIVRNSIDPAKGIIDGYYPKTFKSYRGLLEPLDDIVNQDIVSLLQGHSGSISYAKIDGEVYSLLKSMPSNEDLEIGYCSHLTKFYMETDLLVDETDLQVLLKKDSSVLSQSDESLEAENQKLLRIIGSMLAGIKKSERYSTLSQSALYDLICQTVDTAQLNLSKSTVDNVFSKANHAVKKNLIK
ncbi:hypothetical protein [Acinetobacter indicus]|uniref:hypothetical protein n=1 Tax=Acinetobacter indicus TaxID=756892 RepID=UPI000CEC2FA8|nr:hypothetical protein [Acinetobacter indicus]